MNKSRTLLISLLLFSISFQSASLFAEEAQTKAQQADLQKILSEFGTGIYNWVMQSPAAAQMVATGVGVGTITYLYGKSVGRAKEHAAILATNIPGMTNKGIQMTFRSLDGNTYAQKLKCLVDLVSTAVSSYHSKMLKSALHGQSAPL